MNAVTAPRILVIEDDEAVRRTLVDILEINGYSVDAAADGTEGLARAKQEAPALILTDVAMPGLSGFDLLEAFRTDETLRKVPVIVVTAKVDRAAMRRGMGLGAADFITKPFTGEEVLVSVATRLEKKELLDELDAFAHTVAHDLKSPLATLTGRLELAAMLVGQTDEAGLQRHLREAANSAFRLGGIIDELLVLAGVRRQTVVPARLDTAALVAEALDRIDGLIKQREGEVRCPPDWPAAIGHGPWVTQIWANYLSNAVKYGGPRPRIELGAELVADGRRVRFWVQDHGPGLAPEQLRQVFVPFARISTVRASGHGLGLSIVRRIAEKLDGRVGAESVPGGGARFWFELPADRSGCPDPLAKP
jgi:signal transduction histidine kinase